LDNSIANYTYRPLDYWKPLLLFPFDLFRVAANELPSFLESKHDYPKDSGWVLPLIRAFHQIRPIT
jgi:hypothetical protein